MARMTPQEKAARMAARRAESAEDAPAGPAAPDETGEREGTATAISGRGAAAEAAVRDVRVSLDLKPALYRALGDWNRTAAEELGRGRVTNVQTLRALVRELIESDDLKARVRDRIRYD